MDIDKELVMVKKDMVAISGRLGRIEQVVGYTDCTSEDCDCLESRLKALEKETLEENSAVEKIVKLIEKHLQKHLVEWKANYDINTSIKLSYVIMALNNVLRDITKMDD